MTTGLKVFIFTQATNISADRHDILMRYVIVPCKDAVQSKNVQLLGVLSWRNLLVSGCESCFFVRTTAIGVGLSLIFFTTISAMS